MARRCATEGHGRWSILGIRKCQCLPGRTRTFRNTTSREQCRRGCANSSQSSRTAMIFLDELKGGQSEPLAKLRRRQFHSKPHRAKGSPRELRRDKLQNGSVSLLRPHEYECRKPRGMIHQDSERHSSTTPRLLLQGHPTTLMYSRPGLGMCAGPFGQLTAVWYVPTGKSGLMALVVAE